MCPITLPPEIPGHPGPRHSAEEGILRRGQLAAAVQRQSAGDDFPETRPAHPHVSFDMAMRHMGGDALYLSPTKLVLASVRSIADVARVMSGYVHAMMARVFDHAHVVELAKWSSVPVINVPRAITSTCQAMADALTIIERFGSMKGLNVVFVGDGNNVAVSLMHISVMLGANFRIAQPGRLRYARSGEEDWRRTRRAIGCDHRIPARPARSRPRCPRHHDTWTSMGQEEDSRQTRSGLPAVSGQCPAGEGEARKDVIVMHCLPAHRNQELTDEVADGAALGHLPAGAQPSARAKSHSGAALRGGLICGLQGVHRPSQNSTGAHNYHPLDVVIERASGVWVYDGKATATWIVSRPIPPSIRDTSTRAFSRPCWNRRKR